MMEVERPCLKGANVANLGTALPVPVDKRLFFTPSHFRWQQSEHSVTSQFVKGVL
jgi:hypothetical protein